MLRIVEEKHDCKDCPNKSKAARVLTYAELELLNKASTDVQLEGGEKIMVEGLPHSHIIFLKEGFAKVHMMGPLGRDHIIRIAQPGEYIGIKTLLGGKINHYSATALDAIRACYINASTFTDFIHNNSKFGHEILNYVCEEELGYFKRTVSLQQKCNIGKLAYAIMYISDDIFKDHNFCLPFSYVDFASLVGTTRESVTRGMKELSESNMISVSNRCIEIKNYDMLKKISENG